MSVFSCLVKLDSRHFRLNLTIFGITETRRFCPPLKSCECPNVKTFHCPLANRDVNETLKPETETSSFQSETETETFAEFPETEMRPIPFKSTSRDRDFKPDTTSLLARMESSSRSTASRIASLGLLGLLVVCTKCGRPTDF